MKKFLLLVLILSALTLPVRAEQSAAEEYRQMFRSGNFYVEYQATGYLAHMKKHRGRAIKAGRNGERVTKADVKNNYPDTLFRDGKYYRFRKVNEIEDKSTSYGSNGTIYGKVLAQEDLHSPTLNQDDEWNYIREDLSLPDELAVFCWDEPFRDNFTPAPVYNGSSKRTVDGKEYDCDQYVVDVKSLAGTVIAQEAYNMLYDGGKLVRVQKYLLRDGKEELVVEAEIINISSTVPAEAFTIGKKIKVYAAENGDMQDLLEQPVLVETLGVK